ncbi:MAG: heat-shock protein [Gammaproteobacteria bacterium]|nr:MAG: heat-shock protein [Gammaproteobacteria bacterium]
MRTLDFSPLYRSSVGFDHLSGLLENSRRVEKKQSGYPPYNIEKVAEDEYRISIAVAGFSEQQVEILLQDGVLSVTGKKESKQGEEQVFIHKGIAGRGFQRKFNLSEFIKVKSASMANGLLHIDLERETPEALKPTRIPIGTEQPYAVNSNAA